MTAAKMTRKRRPLYERLRTILLQTPQVLCTAGLLLGLFMTGQAYAAKATGPLRVHPANPRYFADGSGKVIYLTESHTWYNLQDSGTIGASLSARHGRHTRNAIFRSWRLYLTIDPNI
jgi:hypothetical protein